MRAFAHFGIDVDFAAEQVDETLDDRHAIAATLGELVVGLDAHKRLEHFLQLVFGDAHARVGDVENEQVAPHTRLEGDAALQGVFDAVGDDVGQYLFDFQLVGANEGVGLDAVFQLERQVFVAGDGLEHLGGFIAKLMDVEVFLVDLKFALFEARKLQKVGQKVEDMACGLLYRVDFLLVAGLVQEFHITHDGTERCLDVV